MSGGPVCVNCGQPLVDGVSSFGGVSWVHQSTGFRQCIDGQGFARAAEVPGQVSILDDKENEA